MKQTVLIAQLRAGASVEDALQKADGTWLEFDRLMERDVDFVKSVIEAIYDAKAAWLKCAKDRALEGALTEVEWFVNTAGKK